MKKIKPGDVMESERERWALERSPAHCSVIHSSQKVEATHVYISGWMDKQNVY